MGTHLHSRGRGRDLTPVTHATQIAILVACLKVFEGEVAAQSQAWVCRRSLAGIVGTNPAGGMDVSECCVLLGIILCVGIITRP